MRLGRLLARVVPLQMGILGAVAFALALGIRIEPTLAVPAELVVDRTQPVRAAASGRVVDIAVESGERVREGQVLATLVDDAADRRWQVVRARLTALDAERRRAEAELSALRGREHRAARAAARSEAAVARLEQRAGRARLEQARLALEQAARRLERERRLAEAGLLSAAAVDEQRLEVAGLEQRLAERRVEVEVLIERAALGDRRLERLEAEQVREARALEGHLDELEAAREATRHELAGLDAEASGRVLRAPFDGLVVAPPREASLGRWLASGEPLVTVVDPASLAARAWLSEPARLRVRAGNAVRIELDGLPSRAVEPLAGFVVQVAPESERGPDGRTRYAALIQLEHSAIAWGGARVLDLPSGLQGRAEIAHRGSLSLAAWLLERLGGLPESPGPREAPTGGAKPFRPE